MSIEYQHAPDSKGEGAICSEPLKTHFKLSLSPEQYFRQDSARGKSAAPLGTVYSFPKCFGLKSNDWTGFRDILNKKNAEDPENVEHVLIFLARHGQGYHNIGEEYLGAHAWKKASTLSPDKAVHEYFPDTRLTPIGQHQANTLSNTFAKLLDDKSNTIPWPQAFYVSPLHRALETCHRTWAPLANADRPYNPVVQDSLREQMYIEHCNKRSTRTEMSKFEFPRPLVSKKPASASTSAPTSTAVILPSTLHSPNADPKTNHVNETKPLSFDDIFTVEESSLGAFTNIDTLFDHQINSMGRNETEMETTARAYKALTHILAQNWGQGKQFLSITTHAGFMSGVYQIFGLQHHEVPRFPTGIVVPLLIRVEKVKKPVVLRDVALSSSHIVSNLPGEIGALAGRDVNDVLAEICDLEIYSRMIRLVETARRAGAIEDQGWKDRVKADLSPLERIIVRALM